MSRKNLSVTFIDVFIYSLKVVLFFKYPNYPTVFN